MDFTGYKSLYQKGKEQPIAEVFAHFHPQRDPLTGNLDFDFHFVELAEKTLDGKSAWYFESDKFERRYRNKPPKLRNYLNYTFLRLKDLEAEEPGKYFVCSKGDDWGLLQHGTPRSPFLGPVRHLRAL